MKAIESQLGLTFSSSKEFLRTMGENNAVKLLYKKLASNINYSDQELGGILHFINFLIF